MQKPRDGDPRPPLPRKLAEEKERPPLPRKSAAGEKERPPLLRKLPRKVSRFLPRKVEADEKKRCLDQKCRWQSYYDDDDQFCPPRSKAASRPRQAHRQWAMKFGEAEPRYAPPKRC